MSLPPFCYINSNQMGGGGGGGPPSNNSGLPSNNTGPPTNNTNSGGAYNNIDLNNLGIPVVGRVDICFKPEASVEFTILAIMLLYYIPSLLLYAKLREHVLIKYRQPKVVLLSGILSAIMSIIVPFFRYFEVICLVNVWTINLLVFATCIITYSRYVRVYYMQRLSIFKLRFGEKKNSSRKKGEKSKSYNLNSKNSFLGIPSESDTLKTSSFTKSSLSNDPTVDMFGIADPVLYFKKLNKIINKKITQLLVISPIVFIIIYSIIISITNWDAMTLSCKNDHQLVGTPKNILNIFIVSTSVFLFYQAYYKQKWDIEIKIEYTIFIVCLIICTLLMQLTIRNYFGEGIIKYRMYIFYVFTALVHGMCVISPLIKIVLNRMKKDDGRLSEEEFLAKLSNSVFKAQVKEIATNTFCIENVLFFDAHCDLMNMVISYYTKKNGIPTSEATSYSSSDILRTNTICPLLYKPFDNIFKPQYDQIYNLYIREDGIAAINIKSSTIKNIEELMENDSYNYLMFSEAAEEIGDLLYSNIYPRMSE